MLCNSNNTQCDVTTQLQQTESKLSNVFIINIIYMYQTFINLALLQFFQLLPDHEKDVLQLLECKRQIQEGTEFFSPP